MSSGKWSLRLQTSERLLSALLLLCPLPFVSVRSQDSGQVDRRQVRGQGSGVRGQGSGESSVLLYCCSWRAERWPVACDLCSVLTTDHCWLLVSEWGVGVGAER